MIPLKNKNFFLIVFTSCISITTYAQDFTVDILGIQYEYKYDAREKKFTICASTKKNAFFKHEFSYNKSGIELAHNGVRFVKEIDHKMNNNNSLTNEGTNKTYQIVLDSNYKFALKPAYAIVELREGSPAFRSGLKIGDIVLSINGRSTYEYSLQDLMQKFYDKKGTRIKLNVERNGTNFTVNFRLENLFE